VANIKDARAYDYLRTQIHNRIENYLTKENLSPNKELAHLLVYFLTRSQEIETDLSPQDQQKAYIDESNRRNDHN
jgi:thymidylate kinase